MPASEYCYWNETASSKRLISSHSTAWSRMGSQRQGERICCMADGIGRVQTKIVACWHSVGVLEFWCVTTMQHHEFASLISFCLVF